MVLEAYIIQIHHFQNIVDRSGNFHCYFSRSSVAPKQTRDYLNGIWDLSDGNYTNLRDYFCENPILLGN